MFYSNCAEWHRAGSIIRFNYIYVLKVELKACLFEFINYICVEGFKILRARN